MKYRVNHADALSRNHGMLYSSKKCQVFQMKFVEWFLRSSLLKSFVLSQKSPRRDRTSVFGSLKFIAAFKMHNLSYSQLCWHFTEPSPVNWRCQMFNQIGTEGFPGRCGDNTGTVIRWKENWVKAKNIIISKIILINLFNINFVLNF